MTPQRKIKTLLFRLYQQAHRCFYCSCDLSNPENVPTIDHVMPKSLTWISNSLDQPENCVACCDRCNNVKDDKTPSSDDLARLAELNKDYSSAKADQHFFAVVQTPTHLIRWLKHSGMQN